MRRLVLIFLTVLFVFSLAACASTEITPDYADAGSFEAALNAGNDLTGKTVQFTVDAFVPNSTFGYNLQAGEHLNFCSSKNPKVSVGDTVIVEVTGVSNVLGSYIIDYKMK